MTNVSASCLISSTARYRTDKARSNTGTGSGIGLAFVRKAVTRLTDRHYSLVFHGIIGIVIAATAVIIPFGSFASGIKSCAADIICLAVGIAAALLLDRFNRKFDSDKD